MKRSLGTSENQCGSCRHYIRARKISAEIMPMYDRCTIHTMTDKTPGGKPREETRRPAIRFATDSCSDFR